MVTGNTRIRIATRVPGPTSKAPALRSITYHCEDSLDDSSCASASLLTPRQSACKAVFDSAKQSSLAVLQSAWTCATHRRSSAAWSTLHVVPQGSSSECGFSRVGERVSSIPTRNSRDKFPVRGGPPYKSPKYALYAGINLSTNA
jgi:hypothetical protein